MATTTTTTTRLPPTASAFWQVSTVDAINNNWMREFANATSIPAAMPTLALPSLPASLSTSTTSAYACIVFALLLWVLISIGYWAWKLAKEGMMGGRGECRVAEGTLDWLLSALRGVRVYGTSGWGKEEPGCLAWLESSVLIRLTRGIALMRTSRPSQCTITDNRLPLPTLFSPFPFVIWHLTFHVDLAALFCAWLVSFSVTSQ